MASKLADDKDDQEFLLKQLRRGQTALRRLRCRVATVWMVLAVSTAVVYEVIFPHWHWFGRNTQYICPFGQGLVSDLWMHFASEFLFDARLLLLALAPLADDKLLTRSALVLDAIFIAFNRRTILMCMLSGHFLQTSLLQQIMYMSYFSRGVLAVSFALWALCQPTAASMQSAMWVTLAVLLISNMFARAAFGILEAVMLHAPSGELGQLLPNMLAVWVILRPGLRKNMQAKIRHWTELEGATTTAATIACFLGGLCPKQAVKQAKGRFHAMCISDLAYTDLSDQSPNPTLYSLSRPIGLGSCDAFISHSWHDPPDAKWNALQSWRSGFFATRGREPQIWLDRCCIDQSNIEIDLRCLPVFLSGCQSLVVLCGPTYLSRLWCIVEIFTFQQIHGSLDKVKVVHVLRDGREMEDLADIAASFQRFDVSKCQCFKPDDKANLLTIIETVFGSVSEFSSTVGKLMQPLSSQSERANSMFTSDSRRSLADDSSTA